MFRPPDFIQHRQTTLHDLPDELLLNIGAQITHRRRNIDLASLSLVSSIWRPIAQEWLLKKPRFNLTYIDKYLWEVGHHAHLLPQIQSLEIWSKSELRVHYSPTTGAPYREYDAITALDWYPSFVAKCDELIEDYALDKQHARKWRDALHDDCVPALLGLLICTLPNLQTLHLGDAWLMDIPLMSVMISPEAKQHTMLPLEWLHSFLAGAANTLYSSLQVLDIPADMSSIWFLSRMPTIFDFRPFENLREIGITMKALWWCPRRTQIGPPDPRELLPVSLEVLRISEASIKTPTYLANLCAARKGGHFPQLRRVEVYYMNHYDVMIDTAQQFREPHPLWDLQKAFSGTEMELYVYFPAHELKTWEIGGAPWRLKQETTVWREKLESAFRKRMGPFGVRERIWPVVEMEWDVDGDAVMIEDAQ
ncbi:hypothetical protein FB567DRAFT_519048 [Paraphoma chrysanthemicola]|uniref:F-box domain-containing protein n=1 Tax=Paraphoma chrysanthemicola TaxID=798071 RepID=A0A8K0W2U8_9PLEO|nr:hypothetical protein FB567DRAFT_519048 [Paraphoma chrysanthemicola]